MRFAQQQINLALGTSRGQKSWFAKLSFCDGEKELKLLQVAYNFDVQWQF